MILLDNDTKCLVQGITGKQGSFHTEQMLEYNTNILAGVTPGKGGQDFLGVPVFNSIEEAKEETGVNSSIIFVPAKFAKDAAFESIRHLDLVVIISEHIPVQRTVRLLGIDCPESSHNKKCIREGDCSAQVPKGKIAKSRLTELIKSPVRVDFVSKDHYGRELGYVYSSGQDVGLTLLKEGYCKNVSKKYPHPKSGIYNAIH